MEKIAALVIAATVVCLSFLRIDNWQDVGIYAGCGLQGRLLYPFFHAGPVHALLNAWCLLSVVFFYGISVWKMAVAYAVAVTVPVGMMGLYAPTVGLSGVVYFLYGSLSFVVLRKCYHQAWMLFYLGIGFLFPNTNAWLHLYCYILGVVVGLLDKPVKIDG